MKEKGKRTEGEVQSLCREIPDDVGSVSSPEGHKAFLGVGTLEGIGNTLVRRGKTTLLDLDENGIFS